MFCKTAVLKDAIAMAGVEEKQAKVDELRAAILAGNAEAEGLDATNPERQRMMEAWCQSDDPARTADKKSAFMCAKAKAKSEFYKRREVRASRIYLFTTFLFIASPLLRVRVCSYRSCWPSGAASRATRARPNASRWSLASACRRRIAAR